MKSLIQYSGHLLLVVLGLTAALLIAAPASAQSMPCDVLDERFGFTLENYAVEYQHGSMLDIDITYRLITTADINIDDYPDSVPMAETVIQFITDYPTKTDYWEIINKKLTRLLFDQYPQMSGITSHITVRSDQVIPFTKESSFVRMNRPGYCPIP